MSKGNAQRALTVMSKGNAQRPLMLVSKGNAQRPLTATAALHGRGCRLPLVVTVCAEVLVVTACTWGHCSSPCVWGGKLPMAPACQAGAGVAWAKCETREKPQPPVCMTTAAW
eukprot:280829-Chlamydomonas_euryale.AAC.5